VRFEVLTTMEIHIVVFWIITPCSDVDHAVFIFRVKVKAAWSYETPVLYYVTALS